MQAPHRPQAESDPPRDSGRRLWHCRNVRAEAEACVRCRIRMPEARKFYLANNTMPGSVADARRA
jgi:hypothetical protein